MDPRPVAALWRGLARGGVVCRAPYPRRNRWAEMAGPPLEPLLVRLARHGAGAGVVCAAPGRVVGWVDAYDLGRRAAARPVGAGGSARRRLFSGRHLPGVGVRELP